MSGLRHQLSSVTRGALTTTERRVMGKPPLATWKYQHEYSDQHSMKPVIIRALLCVCLVPLVGYAGSKLVLRLDASDALGVTGAAVVLSLVLTRSLSRPVKRISVGPRYLICGTRIVYFANVTAANVDAPSGRLRLALAAGPEFQLEQRKFPTKARKQHKIALNTAAKFQKVTDRILAGVRRAAPQAPITSYRG